MGAAHTPGPWAVRTVDQSLGSVETADGSTQIAQAQEVSVVDRNLGSPERQANASLIAAAPELLEALQGMCIALENIGGEHVTGREGSEKRLEAAYVAIAKATGEQP